MLNGSGRSPEGIDLGTAILAARQVGLLTAGGGHPAAAGLSLKAEHLDELKAFLTTRLQQEAKQMADSPSRLTLDGVLRPSEVTLQRMKAIETLAPFGAGESETPICHWRLAYCQPAFHRPRHRLGVAPTE